MPKQIIIIGGGISGLALLHYLKQKYAGREDIQILLLEKNERLGGTVGSVIKDGCIFETGPNGFLDSKKRTLEFVKELNLENCLVKASQESKIRYLSVHGALHQLPSNPKSFLTFPLLNPLEKLRVLGEFFIPKRCDPRESVYDFGKRRLGEKFSMIFLDPMVSGIYGGDARSANLKSVFPRIYSLEEEYGSLFKAMIKIRKARKAGGNGTSGDNAMGAPAGVLTSFQEGVMQMTEAIGKKYQEDVYLNHEIQTIAQIGNQYTVIAQHGKQYTADELFLCAPAYSAGMMLKNAHSRLSQSLTKINYAPMAVVGLVCPVDYFAEKPKGYGYLIPSLEQKEVLGVLFESNIFTGRCQERQMLFRVMIGGARYPDILKKTKEELVGLALKEIEFLRGKSPAQDKTKGPRELFFMAWPKAIPQYNQNYSDLLKTIDEELQKNPNLHLVANYLKGVSLNDCIESAYQNAQSSRIA